MFAVISNLIIFVAMVRSIYQNAVKNRSFSSITKVQMASFVVVELIVGAYLMPVSIIWADSFTLGSGMCDAQSFINFWICALTLFHMTILAVDRYLAVCHPLVYRLFTTYHAFIAVALAWIILFILCITLSLLGKIDSKQFRFYLNLFFYVVLYLVPILSAIVLYTLVLKEVRFFLKRKRLHTYNVKKSSVDLDTIDKTEDLDTVDKIGDLDTVDTTEDLDTVDKTEDLDTVDKTEDLDTIDKTEDPETVDKTENLDTVDKTKDLDTVDKTEDLDTVDKTEDLDTVDKTEDLDTVDKTEDLDTVDKTEDLDTVDKREDLDTVDKTEDLDTVDKREDLDTVDKTEDLDTVNKMEETGNYLPTSLGLKTKKLSQGEASQVRLQRNVAPRITKLANLKAFRYVGAIIFLSFAWWLPMTTAVIVLNLNQSILSEPIYLSMTWITYTNSILNPLIYCSNKSIRTDIKSLFARKRNPLFSSKGSKNGSTTGGNYILIIKNQGSS
ncbi:trace amine-associated receptor 13c [Biomphalaria glabrata]|nr:trace amine-associated receptor 13c-like [Biomphalaria glabrata]